MFDTSKLIFAKVPKVTNVDIHMPNIHYYIADMRKFLLPNNGEVGGLVSYSPYTVDDCVVLCYPALTAIKHAPWNDNG